jgi:hypothetical protein
MSPSVELPAGSAAAQRIDIRRDGFNWLSVQADVVVMVPRVPE